MRRLCHAVVQGERWTHGRLKREEELGHLETLLTFIISRSWRLPACRRYSHAGLPRGAVVLHDEQGATSSRLILERMIPEVLASTTMERAPQQQSAPDSAFPQVIRGCSGLVGDTGFESYCPGPGSTGHEQTILL